MTGDRAARGVARSGAGALGVGAAACAACCAGPILGALAAVGVTFAVGYMLVGAVAVLAGGAVALLVVARRRRRRRACAAPADRPVPIDAPTLRRPAEPSAPV